MKEYTLEELSEYNGKNGKVYIAYAGQVYDVSDSYLWEGGAHQGLHDSGQDRTGPLGSNGQRSAPWP